MAGENVDKPQGFELKDTEGKSVRVRAYIKKTGDEIAKGDPVSITATGNVELFDAADTSGMIGIAMEYKAATSTDDILICDDPEAVFAVQCDGTFALADIFLNIDIVGGTAVNERSIAEVSIATKAVTATLPFKIIGLEKQGANVVGEFARVLVKPNQHAFKAGVAGL